MAIRSVEKTDSDLVVHLGNGTEHQMDGMMVARWVALMVVTRVVNLGIEPVA